MEALSPSSGTHIVAMETLSSLSPKLTLFRLGVVLSGVFKIERRGVVGIERSELKDSDLTGVFKLLAARGEYVRVLALA